MKARHAVALKGFALLFLSLLTVAEAANNGAPNPSDPAFITSQAAYLKAVAEKQNADVNAYLAWSQRELNHAIAAKQEAAVRYIETMRQVMIAEYDEIAKQQHRIDHLIDGLRANQELMEQIRLGRTSPKAFEAMVVLMATSLEFDPIRESFNRPVSPLPKNNFIPNDDENDTAFAAEDFPGGSLRRLLLFVKKKNFSLNPLYDAHFLIMDALASVSKSAADRVLRNEQEIQSIRAARIVEAFQLPS